MVHIGGFRLVMPRENQAGLVIALRRADNLP